MNVDGESMRATREESLESIGQNAATWLQEPLTQPPLTARQSRKRGRAVCPGERRRGLDEGLLCRSQPHLSNTKGGSPGPSGKK